MDRREAILQRLVEIAATVPGVVTVVRKSPTRDPTQPLLIPARWTVIFRQSRGTHFAEHVLFACPINTEERRSAAVVV
jgi:hypothetical protein